MDATHVVALWLHALSMVVVLGYYGILGRLVLPALVQTVDGPALGRSVAAIERRALPIVLLGIALFVVTGIYLLIKDGRYTGIGEFASTWSVLMLVKHLVVVAMIALGVGVDRLAAAIGQASDEGRKRMVDVLVLALDGMTALGAIVLLLTAAAQLS
jgi:uncharacterized membrane protein